MKKSELLARIVALETQVAMLKSMVAIQRVPERIPGTPWNPVVQPYTPQWAPNTTPRPDWVTQPFPFTTICGVAQ